MHGAGVLRTRRHVLIGLPVVAGEIVIRIRGELVVTGLRAEMPGLAPALEARFAGAKPDIHATDRILHRIAVVTAGIRLRMLAATPLCVCLVRCHAGLLSPLTLDICTFQ
jgi:hypothetical protein